MATSIAAGSSMPPNTSLEGRQTLFENAWTDYRSGSPLPCWDDFLPPAGQPCTPDLVFVLLQIDIEFRVKRGLGALLGEPYFQHPRLQADDARLEAARQVQLIRWEYQQRWQRGDRAARNDYVVRFPEHAAALQDLIARWNCPQCKRTGIPLEAETVEAVVCPRCQTCFGIEDVFPLRPPLLPDTFWTTPSAQAGTNKGLASQERPPLPSPAYPAIPGFEFLGILGRGGMGIVYQAWQVSLNRIVAVKMVLAGADAQPEDLARFLAEAEAVAHVQHPHIVQIFEVGRHAGLPFFALEYLEGGSLSQRLQGAPLPAREAAQLVETLARAMQVAHERGIIHRDLKPANILLDKEGRPKITDFGLAKRIEGGAGLTHTGAVIGTPSYMAPEQAAGKGKEVGPAADIYALGAILYELLTGRPPFKAASALETVFQVLNDEPVPPGRLQSKLPRDLETICLKCLHKEPARRYPSAAALADDLRRYLAGEPIRARRVGVMERGLKWTRRRPAAAALLGVTVLGLVSAAVGGLWYAGHERGRANQEAALRQQAEHAEQQAKRSGEDTHAVLDFFLKQVLAAARPEGPDGGLGIHATIRAAVDAAEPKIAGAFHDRPLVEASIRDALGLTYWYLRETKAAIKQDERALELRRNHLGPDHPDTLTSMNNLALAYQAAGQLAKALPLFEQTLAKRKEKLGLNHPDTLTSMNNLAIAYQDAGQLDKAQPLFEETLAKQQEQLGPDDRRTLISMNNLALVYRDTGQFAKALSLLQRALAKQQEKLGPNALDTLISMQNLATVYLAAGQLDKSLPLFEQTLATFQEKLGPDHPHTLNNMANLARAYQAAGRLDKALPLLEQTLAKSRVKPGPDHPHTLICMGNLASAYLSVGQFTKALPLFEQTFAKSREVLGPDHPDTLNNMNNLAVAYREAGQLGKAVPLFEQTLAKRKERFGPNDLRTLASMGDLALTYLASKQPDNALPLLHDYLAGLHQQWGRDNPRLAGPLAAVGQDLLKHERYADAEPVLRECLTIFQQTQPDTWTTFFTQSQLGGSLLGQKHFAEAEPQLLAGYEGMKQREAQIPAQYQTSLMEALERLVHLYDAWGKAEQANAWRQQREQAKAPAKTPAK